MQWIEKLNYHTFKRKDVEEIPLMIDPRTIRYRMKLRRCKTLKANA